MRLMLIIVLVMGFSGMAFADDASSGCGLGWQVTKRNSLLSSAIRNYTNLLASNTSGMTSGTSGCAKHSIVENEKAAIHFAEANYDQLIMDMAKGNGVYLSAFAQTLGCGSTGMGEFMKISKEQSQKVLASPDVSAVGLVRDIQNEIQTNSVLSSVCSV